MKKMVYIATAQLDETLYSGITKKVFAQSKAFGKVFDIYVIGYFGNDVGIYHNGVINKYYDNKGKHRRTRLFELCKKFALENDVMGYYIRYACSDYGFIKLLKELKLINCKSKVIIEIDTYPYDDRMNRSAKLMAIGLIDKIFRKKMYKYVDKIATFSLDNVIFNIPCIHIINGVDMEAIKRRTCTCNIEDINIIAVSNMYVWHGYDRFIEGIKYYYENGGRKNIILHLVGKGDEFIKYKEMVKEYNLENNVVFYGYKSGKDLDNIYDECDLAIETLGAHRNNLFLSSSLKSREYIARGIPIITSCEIDILDKNYKYLLTLPADESKIMMDEVIEFYDKLFKSKEDKEIIAEELRSYAYDKCDMDVAVKPIVESFLKID